MDINIANGIMHVPTSENYVFPYLLQNEYFCLLFPFRNENGIDTAQISP